MLSGRSAAYSRSSTRRGARHCGPGSSPTGPRPVNQAPRPCSRCALVSRSATTSVTRTVHSSSLRVRVRARAICSGVASPGRNPIAAAISTSFVAQSRCSVRDSTTVTAAS